MKRLPKFWRSSLMPWIVLALGCACQQQQQATPAEPKPQEAALPLGPGAVLHVLEAPGAAASDADTTLTMAHNDGNTGSSSPSAIRCTRVSSLNRGPTLSLPGHLVQAQSVTAHLAAPWPGRVVGVEADVGQQVHEGQPLVRVDTHELHRVVQHYLGNRAAHSKATQTLHQAQQAATSEPGHIGAVAASQATVASLASALEVDLERLQHMGLGDWELTVLRAGGLPEPLVSVVRAPATGLVESIDVAMGQTLQGGETLLRVLTQDGLWAVVRVPAQDSQHVRMGMPVRIAVNRAEGQHKTGTVSFMKASPGSNGDDDGGGHEVRLALGAAEGALQPGKEAMAHFQLGFADTGHYLPTSQVHQAAGGPAAFVCRKDGSYALVRVAVGEERSGLLPLKAGLKHSDAVVVQGAEQLRANVLRQQQQAQ